MALVPDSFIEKDIHLSTTISGDECTVNRKDGSFTAWVACGGDMCGQHIGILGSVKVFEFDDYSQPLDDEGDPPVGYGIRYDIVSIHPAPKIIELPQGCPQTVQKEVERAFALYYSDLASCANKIRVAVERLLDYLEAQILTEETDSGKRVSLHDRINRYCSANPSVGKYLQALKAIGNVGSHENLYYTSDILDCFEILEYALQQIIEPQCARIDIMASKILEKHR